MLERRFMMPEGYRAILLGIATDFRATTINVRFVIRWPPSEQDPAIACELVPTLEGEVQIERRDNESCCVGRAEGEDRPRMHAAPRGLEDMIGAQVSCVPLGRDKFDTVTWVAVYVRDEDKSEIGTRIESLGESIGRDLFLRAVTRYYT